MGAPPSKNLFEHDVQYSPLLVLDLVQARPRFDHCSAKSSN
jgi:hypothetical protein